MSDATPDTSQAPDPEGELATFRARRDLAVVQAKGNLALVSTQWVDSEQPLWGVPGISGVLAPLPEGESGLKFTAAPADGVLLDGEVVDGTVVVRGKDVENPGELIFSETVTGFVIAGPAGIYALRVWDADSEGIQNFDRIDAYPYNPDWVVDGQFESKPGMTIPFEYSKSEGKTRQVEMPGEITFTKDGEDYVLAAIKSGRALQVVFSDATSGVDTYSVGRFLYVAPDAIGRVKLDFNRAVLPPCGFSSAFNCPMPPKQNRFTVAVQAGEKNLLLKDGMLLH